MKIHIQLLLITLLFNSCQNTVSTHLRITNIGMELFAFDFSKNSLFEINDIVSIGNGLKEKIRFIKNGATTFEYLVEEGDLERPYRDNRADVILLIITDVQNLKIRLKYDHKLGKYHILGWITTEPEKVRNDQSKLVFLEKIPDSLEFVAFNKIIGDFNGDGKIDFSLMVNNKRDNQKGVLISHNSDNQELFIFGAGKEVNQMTDLNWIEVFETIPKGEIIAPTIVDEKTGDIIGPDEKQNFKLIGNGIYMGVEESHGGGILFWNGKEYQWYHIE